MSASKDFLSRFPRGASGLAVVVAGKTKVLSRQDQAEVAARIKFLRACGYTREQIREVINA